MPRGVVYKNLEDAQDYADDVRGDVEAVDSDGDGENDGWIVVPVERVTRGPPAGDVGKVAGPEADKEYERYLSDLEAAAPPPREGTEDPMAALDELGYRHGGMSFTARGPIRYSKGGAVKGKTFRGSF